MDVPIEIFMLPIVVFVSALAVSYLKYSFSFQYWLQKSDVGDD